MDTCSRTIPSSWLSVSRKISLIHQLFHLDVFAAHLHHSFNEVQVKTDFSIKSHSFNQPVYFMVHLLFSFNNRESHRELAELN